ncbi:hypothetical protein Taro_000881 [Colocasia esculenta]|uniref:PsbP C-terminal domain-containing protein n=1 Tax=Colocasia esculenta TaxID=4460 RepID=A0A843TEJ3_COLES|nr:hypothetical protein [Colocasia esculenta]
MPDILCPHPTNDRTREASAGERDGDRVDGTMWLPINGDFRSPPLNGQLFHLLLGEALAYSWRQPSIWEPQPSAFAPPLFLASSHFLQFRLPQFFQPFHAAEASGPFSAQKGTVLLSGRSSYPGEDSDATKRRQALFQILVSALSLPSVVAGASAEAGSSSLDLQNFRTYEDATNKFQILVPQVFSDRPLPFGPLAQRPSFMADRFHDKSDETSDEVGYWLKVDSREDWSKGTCRPALTVEKWISLVSIVITGVGPDYTRMESFGSADAFAERLVNGLDRSWKRPPGLAAKLIDSKSVNGLYYIEYTLQNPGESPRHIVSAVGMAFNGWYNRLYTVTGQFLEDNSEEKYKSLIEKAVSSFSFGVLMVSLENFAVATCEVQLVLRHPSGLALDHWNSRLSHGRNAK